MDYQVKRAQVKGHSESQPADARPLDSTLKVIFTRTSFNLLSRPRNIGSSGWENEDQHLFKQPLPQDFGCGDQGQRSKRPTLPDQLWALLRASDSLVILLCPAFFAGAWFGGDRGDLVLLRPHNAHALLSAPLI